MLVRSDGHPAYNFAVVIDDALMGVTHVIRGEDHISNTPRQLLLYEAFGYAPPAFAHLSLVLGPDHSPLSKRHGATSVAEFREKGYLPEALFNYLALIGWSPGHDEELLPAAELAARFKLEDVGHSAGVFDEDKLAWVNRHYLKAAAPARLASLAVPYLQPPGMSVSSTTRAARSSSRWCRSSRRQSIVSSRCPIGCTCFSRSTRQRRSRGRMSRAELESGARTRGDRRARRRPRERAALHAAANCSAPRRSACASGPDRRARRCSTRSAWR